jgi:hypothetical protein
MIGYRHQQLRIGGVSEMMTDQAHTTSGIRARVAAHVRARSLDGELMSGAEVDSDAARARAALLTSRRHRESLAHAIDGVIAAANGPASLSRISPAREPVLANAPRLYALARRLRTRSPMTPRALASLTSLLSDGTGPVFRGDATALATELELLDDARGVTATGPARERAVAH